MTSDGSRIEFPRARTGPVFGGELLALGVEAAARTVPAALPIHSLHAFFLRGGDATAFTADASPLRDGRTSAVREVRVGAGGEERCRLVVSFHAGNERDDLATRAPDAPHPDGDGPWRADPYVAYDGKLPFDIRHVEPVAPSTARLWMRAREPLGDDAVRHASALAMASDVRTGLAASAPLGEPYGVPVSLDHAMWFHRPIRADEWFLLDLWPVSVGSGRGLVHGTVHSIDGTHAASFTQEASVRPG